MFAGARHRYIVNSWDNRRHNKELSSSMEPEEGLVEGAGAFYTQAYVVLDRDDPWLLRTMVRQGSRLLLGLQPFRWP